MEAKAKLFGHPIHQMLIVFPLGLLATSVIFDVLYLWTQSARWSEIAYYLIGAGVLTGLVAAPFGTIDWLAIPRGTRAKRVGTIHGVGNVLVLVMFAYSWWLRRQNPIEYHALAILVSVAGAAVSVGTAWLGGELVDQFGIGVNDHANLDAPMSVSAPKHPVEEIPIAGRERTSDAA